jgi:hypothetical protein
VTATRAASRVGAKRLLDLVMGESSRAALDRMASSCGFEAGHQTSNQLLFVIAEQTLNETLSITSGN